MEQHPIPQDITGFKFKLVGDMTLGQFGYLAGGLISGWLVFSTPWYPFVRYPLAIICASAGAAFAFLPVEDRPLAVWVKNFLKSIYQPTFLVWEKTASVPLDSPLLSSPFSGFNLPKFPAMLSFPKKQEVKSNPTEIPVKKEIEEKKADSPISVTTTSNEVTQKPLRSVLSVDELLKMREDKVAQISQGNEQLTSIQSQIDNHPPEPQEPAKIMDISQLEQLREKGLQGPTFQEQIEKLVLQNADLAKQIDQIKSAAQQLTLGAERSALETQLQELAKTRESITLRIGQLQQAIDNPPKPTPVTPPQANISVVTNYARAAPTVSLSDLPNVLSGLIKDALGNPVLGAIVLINDQSGNPVRALKTNKIGQFITNTPLDNGTYYIQVEKEGYVFDTVSAQLTGQVLPLMEIGGKMVNLNQTQNGSI